MVRTVKREIIDFWVSQRRDGVGELSRLSKVPSQSISKIRNGRIPKSPLVREALANALGVEESELFPEVKSGKSRAS